MPLEVIRSDEVDAVYCARMKAVQELALWANILHMDVKWPNVVYTRPEDTGGTAKVRMY